MAEVIKIVEYLRKSKYATLWIALTFAVALFTQCCMFYYFTDGVSVFSCFLHPRRIISIYFQKVAISIFLASLVFLFERKYWTIYVLCVNAIWILAECVYMQAFDGMLIDAYSLSMADNLDGFTESILMYMQPCYLWLLLPVVCMAVVLYCFDNRQSVNWKYSCVGIIFSMMLNIANAAYVTHYNRVELLEATTIADVWNPISSNEIDTSSPRYAYFYSSVHAFLRVGYEMIFNREEDTDVEQLTQDMQLFVQSTTEKPVPQSKLVIFLVESLENWAILPEITPNICRYMETHNTIYAPYIKRQAKKGGSMDGQILVHSGILPIKNGASCFRFPRNRYPSIGELYDKTAILVPGGPKVWNQGLISAACGVDTNYTVSMNDAEIFKQYQRVAEQYDYVMVITASSHSPFKKYADSSGLVLPTTMPELMRNYLKTINFMDRCLGDALQMIDESAALRDAVVVITGDHTIFSNNFREEFDAYCQSGGELQYKVNEAYCPLIVGGGRLKKSSHIMQEAYQMDIYPTILRAIGCDSFFWKGWGVDLSDSLAITRRPILEEDAFDMADQVIRSNWFRIYERRENK